jgi:hypothetical protein
LCLPCAVCASCRTDLYLELSALAAADAAEEEEREEEEDDDNDDD